MALRRVVVDGVESYHHGNIGTIGPGGFLSYNSVTGITMVVSGKVSVPKSTVPPTRAPAGSILSNPTTDMYFTDSGGKYGTQLMSNATMRRVPVRPGESGSIPVASYAITGMSIYDRDVGRQMPITGVDDYSVLGKPNAYLSQATMEGRFRARRTSKIRGW